MKKAQFTSLINGQNGPEAETRAGYLLFNQGFYFGIYKERGAWYVIDLITGLKCDMAGYHTRKEAERAAVRVYSPYKMSEAVKANLKNGNIYTQAIQDRASAAGFMEQLNQFLNGELCIEALSRATTYAWPQEPAPETSASVNIQKIKVVNEAPLHYLQKDIMCASDAAAMFREFLPGTAEEYFMLLCLNAKGFPAGIHEVSHGDLSTTLVSPREVFKRALLNNACSIIICHNHPSGGLEPSDADIYKTLHHHPRTQRYGDHIIHQKIIRYRLKPKIGMAGV